MNETLHTKYGTVKINKNGYYRISSWKEGNNGKLLHRLIWEDFYNCSVPEGYVIHHKNKIKTDNCILNLQLMRDTDHKSLHHKGKIYSEETRKKMSETRKGKTLSEETCIELSKSHNNNTGVLRVTKMKCPRCKDGFIYRYRYYDKNSKRKSINDTDINVLEEKVKAKGLKWLKLDKGA